MQLVSFHVVTIIVVSPTLRSLRWSQSVRIFDISLASGHGLAGQTLTLTWDSGPRARARDLIWHPRGFFLLIRNIQRYSYKISLGYTVPPSYPFCIPLLYEMNKEASQGKWACCMIFLSLGTFCRNFWKDAVCILNLWVSCLCHQLRASLNGCWHSGRQER